MASASAAAKKLVSASDESVLRNKILETHAYVGGSFDSGSVLTAVEGILSLVTPGVDATLNVSCFFYARLDFILIYFC